MSYQTPYALSADCVLSEDYFPLSFTGFDATDKIIGYPRNNAFEVEAFVVKNSGDAGGALLQLFHGGPTESWVLQPVSDGTGDVTGVADVVAGVTQYANGDIDALQLFVKTGTDVSNYTCAHLARDVDGDWHRSDLGWPGDVGPLRITIDESTAALLAYAYSPGQHSLYWTSITLSSSGIETSTSGVVPGLNLADAGSSPVVSVRRTTSGKNGGLVVYSVYRGFLVAGLAADYPAPGGYEMASGGSGSTWQPPNGATVVGIEGLFEFDYDLPPIAVISDSANCLWAVTLPALFASSGDVSVTPTWTKLWQAGSASSKAPVVSIGNRTIAAEPTSTGSIADKALDLYVVSDSGLSVVHQIATGDAAADSTTPQFTAPLPLQLGVGSATLPVNRGPGTGLILLNSDGSLQSLTLQQVPVDPSTGAAAGQAWVAAAIALSSATETLKLAAYRTQVSLQDDYGVPMANTPVSIGCAMSVPAVINGQPYALGPTPITTTTGVLGQLSIAVPATGVSTPALTVSMSNGPTMTVNPSANVNTYLAGTGTLNQLPPLTSGAVLTSTQPGSTAPIASGLSPAAAAAAVASLNQVAAAVSVPQTIPTTTRSTLSSSRSKTARPAATPRLSLATSPKTSDFGSIHFSDFLHDVVHAISQGAVAVLQAAVTAATKTYAATVDIVTDVEALAGAAIRITLHDLDDVANAVHSVVNMIKVDVMAFVDWLKAQVLTVLTDSLALADAYLGLVVGSKGLAPYLAGEIGKAEGKANGWFASQEATVTQGLEAFAKKHTGTLDSLSSSVSTVRSRPQQARLAAATPNVGSSTGSAHANWLLDKIEQYLTGTKNGAEIAGLGGAIDTFLSALLKAVASLGSTVAQFWAGFVAQVANPKELISTSVATLITGTTSGRPGFTGLAGLVSAVLAFADSLVEAFLALTGAVLDAMASLLATSADSLPVIGPLLKAAGGSNTPSLGQIAALIFAFPATLAYKLANGWEKHPVDALTSSGGIITSADVSAADYFDVVKPFAAAGMSVWAVLDAASAVVQAVDEESGGGDVPAFLAVVDLFAPFLIGALTYPGGNPFAWQTGIQETSFDFNFLSWFIGMGTAVIDGLEFYYDGSGGARRQLSTAEDQALLSIESVIGILTTVFGIVGDATAGVTSAAEYGYDILGNLATIGAVGLTTSAVDASGGLSAAAVAAVGLICGAAGVTSYLEAPTN